MRTVRAEACDNQAHVKAAGRSSAPPPAVITTPQTSQNQLKTDLRSSAPLKSEEQDKRQTRDLSPTKPVNNSWEIKIESG